jgi:(p)ppGpp synthase/HD superfamily hydrolase
LAFLDKVDQRLINIKGTQLLEITLEDRKGLMDEVRNTLTDAGLTVRWTGFEKIVDQNQVRFDVTVKVPKNLSTDGIIGRLGAMEGVVSFKLQ